MTRLLPGVYVKFQDYSTLPEGSTNLTVGYVLQSKRGPIKQAELVTSPTDFLSKFTFSGSPTIKDDRTFWSILQVLKYTNQVYVVRAAKNALFGGIAFTAEGGTAFTQGKADLGAYDSASGFGDGELLAITGVDAGAYNNEIGIGITSYADDFGKAILKDYFENEDAMKAAKPFMITVVDTTTGETLEEYLVSRLDNAKSFDGTPLFVETVTSGSAYIRCFNNEAVEGDIPSTTREVQIKQRDEVTGEIKTVTKKVLDYKKLGGGTDGDALKVEDLVGALDVFSDKTIPVSLLGNGSGALYEHPTYQSALIALAEERKDCMAFLNSREIDEKATFNSKKASNIITYKKGAGTLGDTLPSGNTSYLACMYAPHVNYSDVFNSRQVKLGADSTAISGWLNVILNTGYPYAFAGPQDGLVNGVSTTWKIGDMSGEATNLNDASINYIAYDAKVGRYYMQCQNTLQIANSSLRNIGAVLNILDIKETFMTFLKEYLQKPITPRLREEIYDKCNTYLKEQILGADRCINYSFADTTTDYDLSDNTLRYVLAIALTPYAQKIYLTMNIVNANYDFSISQG